MTLSAIGTRFRQTIVHIRLAERSRKSWNAEATERVDEIRTSSTVEAWIVGLTVVNIRLTEGTSESSGTDALESIHLVDARSTILASVYGAIIHLVSAIGAIESFWAHAHVAVVGSVDTSGGVVRTRLLS